MGVVLVHGNPETSAVWDPLLAALGRDDVTCLSPPGFGAPVPDGWSATVEGYRDWLIDELEAFGSPVDLVGHDWGGGHAVTAAIARPDLLRSWCTDVIGIFDPEYVWHELAQVWQTPDTGEQAVAAWAAESVEERAARLGSLGITAEVAERLAAGFDETMGRCILALYRSAAQPKMAQLGQGLDAAAQRPGLHLRATEDHFVGTEEMQRRAAARAGARIEVLDGLGHWWMTQDPARGAAALTRFWESIPD
jgi:pimeloyl-ACP methyl ester carboxylesterase